jgi:hypothetical protein
MRTYKKLEVSEEYYKEIMNNQFKNGSIVREHIMGRRAKLYSDNMFIATKCDNTALDVGDLTDSKFYSFIGLFNKQLYRQFELNPNLFFLDVEFQGLSRQKNFDTWNGLEVGDFFYNIDLNSAYWQVANKLGYVNDKMFEKYLNQDAYKQVKRYVISFLGRKNVMKYYSGDITHTIECDSEFLKKVYMNIRFCLYNYITDCIRGVDNWIEYNIDGVVVTNKDVEKVMQYFQDSNLKFKMTECRKMSDTEYLFKNRLRIFKHKLHTV